MSETANDLTPAPGFRRRRFAGRSQRRKSGGIIAPTPTSSLYPEVWNRFDNPYDLGKPKAQLPADAAQRWYGDIGKFFRKAA
jgi:hypothetical protein